MADNEVDGSLANGSVEHAAGNLWRARNASGAYYIGPEDKARLYAQDNLEVTYKPMHTEDVVEDVVTEAVTEAVTE